MSKNIQISQKYLFVLGGLLLVSVAVAGYLLGKQSVQSPVAQPLSSPSPRLVPLAKEAESNLDSRVTDLEGRVGTLRQPTVEQTPVDSKAQRVYFQELNSILGSSAIKSSQPMATRLTELAVSSDKEGHFESILAQTTTAATKVEALNAPRACLEHKGLVLGQLQHSLTLLRKVQLALESRDAAKLQALSEFDDRILNEALRLQKLDDTLRPQR